MVIKPNRSATIELNETDIVVLSRVLAAEARLTGHTCDYVAQHLTEMELFISVLKEELNLK
jgi:hypothetical protein